MSAKRVRTIKVTFGPEYPLEWPSAQHALLQARRAILFAMRDKGTVPELSHHKNEALNHLEKAINIQ